MEINKLTKVFRKFVGKFTNSNTEYDLTQYRKTLKQVTRLEREYKRKSSDELAEQFDQLKARVRRSGNLSAAVVESFAIIRETIRRELGLDPFKEKMLAGLAAHSRQIAWQFQSFRCGNGTVIIVIESYSRYVLLLPFFYSPTWDEVKVTFYEQWFADMQGWMNRGGFVRNSQHQAQLEQQFQAQSEPPLYRNLDMSINGYLTDTQFWIRDYMDQMAVQSFDQQMAQELGAHINNQPKRVKDANGKKCKFSPLERFLDDSLHRFAQGLCDQLILGCAEGRFPNPHKREPKLTVV